MTRMWSLIILTGIATLTSTLNNAEAHRIKRQVYRNYAYQNTGYGNSNNYYTNTGYANNALNNAALMEYYHSLWDQMHESAMGAIPPMDPFGQQPPIDPFAPPPPAMDPFAPPPPDMDPFAPPPPGMDPFAPPPPDMDPFAPPPPGMDPFAPPPPDPAFDEWAHRMGWIADPAPPPDPALEDYMRRLAWEHLAFDPTVESELFHGFGFIPNGWLYEHYIPEDYVLSNYG